MKLYFTFKNYSLMTGLQPQEVCERIAAAMETMNTDNLLDYDGEVTGNKFKIRKVEISRNAIQPVIKGIVSAKEDHTQIDVKLRPSLFSFTFYLLIFLLFGTAVVLFILLPMTRYIFIPIMRYVGFGDFILRLCLLIFYVLIWNSSIKRSNNEAKALMSFISNLLEERKEVPKN